MIYHKLYPNTKEGDGFVKKAGSPGRSARYDRRDRASAFPCCFPGRKMILKSKRVFIGYEGSRSTLKSYLPYLTTSDIPMYLTLLYVQVRVCVREESVPTLRCTDCARGRFSSRQRVHHRRRLWRERH